MSQDRSHGAPAGQPTPDLIQISTERPSGALSRRGFLGLGAAAGFVAGQVTSQALIPQAAHPAPVPSGPSGALSLDQATLKFFTQDQARLVEAISARIIPSDEEGPGAREAGVVYFIDQQLANQGFFGQDYRQGPYVPGLPTQGDQSQLSMRDRYRVGLAAVEEYSKKKFGRSFVDLTGAR